MGMWFWVQVQRFRLRNHNNIGALTSTYTILGVPSYNDSIMGPQNPILIIKGPILRGLVPRAVKLKGRSAC